nr:putative ribonuclease H-like domain-containing protein [Tanacetum cinerariifolium]
MDVEIEKDDLNQKFLTSLAPEWLMHTIVWKNRSDLDIMSLDDLYNHLKVYESEVQKKPESNAQNMAFISSAKHNSGKEDGNTASVPTASASVVNISQDTANAYIASQSSGSQIKFEDINQIDEDDMDEMDIKWNMALLSMRADKDWSYMANDKEDHALVADEVAPTKFTLMANTGDESKKLETLQQEKEGVDGKLACLLTASKDLDNLIESKRSEKNKEGLGYTAVPPPAAQLYLFPKKDLSWTGLPECADDTVTDYSRPTPTIESTSENDQNRNTAVPRTTLMIKAIGTVAALECIVLGRDFKLLDDANILLRTPRQHNMYSIDLKNIVPHIDLTCLVAKASAEECILWHRRLGHLNFKTMNKLVRHNLVRGLPTKCFENNHTSTACLKAKQHKATCKSKLVNSVTKPLHTLHMDLFGPTSVSSISHKWYCLVVTDDFSRPPAIGFLKPFGCHVMILNTLDNLGKFEEKGDKGYFIGYLMSSRAFKVFNKRTRRVEENLYVEFLEKKAIQKVSGPNWLFDIDSLTKSINYVPVDVGTIFTNLSGTKDASRQEVWKDVSSLRYIALPNWAHDALLEFSSSQPQDHCSTEVPEGSGNSNPVASTSNTLSDQMETLTVETPIPTVSSPVPTVYSTDSQESSSDARLISKRTLVDCPKGVRPIGTKWVLKNKRDERVIVIRNKARLVAQGHTQEEGIDYDEVFAPVARIEDIKLFLAYASFVGFIVYLMDVKSAFLYGTIDEEVYVMHPLGFQDPDFPAKVYKVEKAMYGLHQSPRAWYGTLSKYLLKNGFQSLCREFEALMHEKFQMSAMGELNFFLGLEVLQKKVGIFLSQDKYVGDILKKFRYTDVRSSNTPMDKENPWEKDGTRKDVDLHLYRSMIGSLMYLTSSIAYIMFVVCACARHQVTPKECHLHAVKRIFRYLKGHPKLGLWYPKDSPFDLVSFSNSYYGGATQDRKSTTGRCQFLGRRVTNGNDQMLLFYEKSSSSQEVKKDVSSLRYIALPNWVHDALLELSSMETPIPTVSLPVPTACFTDSPEPSSDARLILKRVANQVETPSLDNILTLANRFEDILGVTTIQMNLMEWKLM